MDTSKEYILMCEKAWPDLAQYWNPSDGYTQQPDIVQVVQYANQCPKDKSWGSFTIDNAEYCRECGTKMSVEKHSDYVDYAWDGSVEDLTDGGKDSFPIFRQDQLQEMVFCPVAMFWEYGDGTIGMAACETQYKPDWENPVFSAIAGSREQLWLQYVMFRKFNKSWNGEDWVTD